MEPENEKSRSAFGEQSTTNVHDAEQSIAEFEQLSGRGDSQGWNFNREEIHESKQPPAAEAGSML